MKNFRIRVWNKGSGPVLVKVIETKKCTVASQTCQAFRQWRNRTGSLNAECPGIVYEVAKLPGLSGGTICALWTSKPHELDMILGVIPKYVEYK